MVDGLVFVCFTRLVYIYVAPEQIWNCIFVKVGEGHVPPCPME